tara:strand:+ start:768 stop:917 length:150 start_codon:yes stop_codon:yes gene_type:complete
MQKEQGYKYIPDTNQTYGTGLDTIVFEEAGEDEELMDELIDRRLHKEET